MKDQSGIPDPACAGLVWLALGDVAVPAGSPSVPGFRVLGVLGSGGQGTTWLAARESDGLTVALKVVQYAGSRFPERYWDELSALRERRLSCIARLVGHGIADGHPWIATEYIDGETLDAWAARHDRAAALEMLAKVADALASLHASGLVHRDIKPANIIVDDAGHPILIDLGLGTFIDSPLDRTIDGLPAGSPAFMSPEQARGERSAIGPATDIWSLGATAFLLLAGELPHASAGSVAAQVARAGTEPPRRAARIDPSLPPAIAAVLDWAVRPRIEDRPPSAAALAHAFRRAAEGRSVAPGSGASRPIVLGSCVIVALVVVTLLAVMLRPRDAAPDHAPPGALAGPAIVPLTADNAVMIPGDYPNSKFGSAIARIGDLDDDGFPEVAIGAPDAPGRQPDGRYVELAGEISIFRGADLRAALAPDAARVLAPVHRIAGADKRGHAGVVICSAGDMDGDHIAELATLAEGPEHESGTVTIVNGSQVLHTKSLAQCVADGQAIRIDGVSLRKLPSGMAHCDVDGDGLEDLLVGCPGTDGQGGARAGEVMVVHGARSLFGPESRAASVRRVAAPDGVFGFGASLATVLGDDGTYVVIGAPLGERPGPGGTGRIVLARAEAFAAGDRLATPTLIASRGRPDEWFGESVAAESSAVEGRPCERISVIAGGSGVANASNDGGMAECIEYVHDADGTWREVNGPRAWRGLEGPLGRGQQMGAAVAVHRDFCCSLPIAIASPRDGTEDVAAGSVMLQNPWTPNDPAGQADRTIYRGSKRAFEAGRGLAWWYDNHGHRSDWVALLIGAPGEDSPSRQAATGAVWIVPYSILESPEPESPQSESP